MSDLPIKVLLIDDDEDDFVITRDLVLGMGGRVRLDWISSYALGLDALSRREHDVCLLDYRLGERTGLELLRDAHSRGCVLPIILLTGQGDHEVDVEAMKAGAADYLIKGNLNTDALERAMRYAIAGKRAQEELRRERDLISRITETSPVGIVVADRSGTITFANHRAERVLGISRESVSGGSCSVFDWSIADREGNPVGNGSNNASPLRSVLDAGASVQDVRCGVNLPEGRRVVLSANAAPLFNSDAKVDGMVVTVEDITEQLSLEAQLRQSQKMESIGQLAAGVAHDINNILTVVQGHTGLLLATIDPASPTLKSLKQISSAAERAARFIRQLLMFSRKQVIQPKVLDLNIVIRNVENMLSRMLGEDITLEMRYVPDIPRVEADTGMVEQVILNLAVNARDAMPRGGKLIVATSVITIDPNQARRHPDAKAGEYVCLSVTDTGCGIDRKHLPKIFEPFFSTKEVGRGTGLGLATVYGIVKQHHGWIEVESQLGLGTTFQVFLPATRQSSGFPTDFVMRTGPIRGGTERILIVEDEPGLRELVFQVLSQYKYQVTAAASGPDAIRTWEQHRGEFDLLLTDMIMPGGMNGRELADELKRRKPNLRIVYTSGYSADLVSKNLGNGSALFLPKPYMPPQLAFTIRECLDNPVEPPAREISTPA